MKISNTEAIISLNPNAEFKCNNDDIDTIKWLNGTEEISKSTILAEVKRLQAEYEANQYQRNRAVAYDPIPEQLDQIYHDIDGWKAKIKKIKDKFPKP